MNYCPQMFVMVVVSSWKIGFMMYYVELAQSTSVQTKL
jgi:hypothetical protein